ncbi:MAG TPA: cytochrome c [Gemmatimonadaceae bacterium]
MPAQAAAQEQRTVWDGVYTAEQAARGKAEFDTYCAMCHGENLRGGDEAPPLVGTRFMGRWAFVTANQLYREITTRMPDNDPGSLSAATYLDVVTYILQANKFPAGAEEFAVGPDVPSVLIVEENAPKEIPTGTLVQVVGCLTRSPDSAWVLTNTSDPSRTEDPDASEGDSLKRLATAPLGKETFGLMGIFTPLDANDGHKMEIKGFLIRDPGGRGSRINVVALETVNSSCEQ